MIIYYKDDVAFHNYVLLKSEYHHEGHSTWLQISYYYSYCYSALIHTFSIAFSRQYNTGSWFLSGLLPIRGLTNTITTLHCYIALLFWYKTVRVHDQFPFVKSDRANDESYHVRERFGQLERHDTHISLETISRKINFIFSVFSWRTLKLKSRYLKSLKNHFIWHQLMCCSCMNGCTLRWFV